MQHIGEKRPRGEDVDSWRIARPFPSTSVLASLPSKSKTIPLLKGILPEKEDHSPGDAEDNSHDDTIAAIDNPRNSTLTSGQHERYLKLKNEKGSHREFRKLRALVRAEQELYRRSRDEFFLENSQRFLTGFAVMPSEYATWHAEYTQAYSQQWKDNDCPMEYGKVRQMISLSGEHDENWMPNEVFESQVVVPVTVESPPTTLPPMQAPKAQSLLRDDAKALALAKQHGVSAIVSSQVLEHVLTLDEWKVPLWNQGIRILEEPLPQPTLPRTCLTRGMEEALNLSSADYIYTILTVKPTDKTILVRCKAKTNRVHLQYFPDRGLEQPTSEEMALWILDSLMVKSASRQLLLRINILDWSISSQEPVSVAHALASGNDVMNHWNRLLHFFNSLDILPANGDYLLKCQGKTVSLHHAKESDVAIDLKGELESADAVKTNSKALLACARPWKWTDATRVVDTFPPENGPQSASGRQAT